MPEVVFSLVIPAFNAAAFIEEAVWSVLSDRTEYPYEILVVDDGSTDGTADAVRRIGHEVRLLGKDNGGPGSARNLGVREARSGIILFLDADDRVLPGRLQQQVSYMLSHRETVLSFGDIVYESRPAHDRHRKWNLPVGPEPFCSIPDALERLLRYGCYPNMTASAVRREAHLRVGGQREDVRVFEDYDVFCKLARAGVIACSAADFAWKRGVATSHLMASRYAYTDPPRVLKDVLEQYGGEVSAAARRAALRRFIRSSEMMLRYLWAEEGPAAVEEACRRLQPLLPRRMAARWRMLSHFPQAIPRAVRRMARRMRNA